MYFLQLKMPESYVWAGSTLFKCTECSYLLAGPKRSGFSCMECSYRLSSASYYRGHCTVSMGTVLVANLRSAQLISVTLRFLITHNKRCCRSCLNQLCCSTFCGVWGLGLAGIAKPKPQIQTPNTNPSSNSSFSSHSSSNPADAQISAGITFPQHPCRFQHTLIRILQVITGLLLEEGSRFKLHSAPGYRLPDA